MPGEINQDLVSPAGVGRLDAVFSRLVSDFKLPLALYPVLFLTGLGAGFVDTIAGGGGLITIPMLLSLGMPEQLALGTNKLQATFGSASATWFYGRAGLIDFKACRLGVVFTLIGATTGSLLVSHLPPDVLRLSIPWLLLAIALYFLVQPKVGESDRQARLGSAGFHAIFGLGIGFYDGFFGPGTGTFWAMAYVLGLGYNLTRATASTKVMNCTSNVASLLVFAVIGQAHYGAGLCMGLGQVAGARLGSRVVIARGTRLVRPVFIAVVLALTARLLWKNFTAAPANQGLRTPAVQTGASPGDAR